MAKKLLYSFLLFHFSLMQAQNEYTISGKIIQNLTKKPVAYAIVTLQNSNFSQTSSTNGSFNLNIPYSGKFLLAIRSQGYKELLLPITLANSKLVDLGIIQLEENYTTDTQSAWINLEETELSEDNETTENTSVLLQASRDIFLQSAAFNWGQARFKVRGLDSQNSALLLNGLTMNKIYDNRPQWSNWGGLNDVLRNQEFTLGAAASPYTFGGILGMQIISTRASHYAKGTRITFSGSNTNYNWRTMASYATGMSAAGWAMTIAASKRYAKESYFDGSSFVAESFFISIEKRLNDNNSLNITAIYTPASRGKNSPNTAEVSTLTSEKYNSYWGWQDGKKRNSRIKKVAEPIFMLNHYLNISDKTKLNSGLAYQFGSIANSAIDYQDANSPDPTYYRKLPSYYTSLYEPDEGENPGAFTPNYEEAEKSKNAFLQNQQINWESLYSANQQPIINNGLVSGYSPSKSHYIVFENRNDDQLFTANTTLFSQVSDNCILNAGAMIQHLNSDNFQYVTDLLGGAYFEDIDAFYTGDQSQSDLQHPNRQVKVGDKYGYNYTLTALTYSLFTQFNFDYKKFDFYLAQTFSSNQYSRNGHYQNGLYPTSSLGKSKTATFDNFGFKGGITYKISGRQWLFVNAIHQTIAPNLRNTFPNVRLNNKIVENIQNEKNSAAELSYVYRTPKFKSKITAYFNQIESSTQNSFFYAEGIFDDGTGYENTDAFVGQTLTGLNKRNIGIELGLEYQVTSFLKPFLAINYGDYLYTSNPNVTLTNDAVASVNNTNPEFDFGTAILKNYKQPGTPQQAYCLGLEYKNPHYWWLSANVNYLDELYIDIAPIARTSTFFKNPATGTNFPEATQDRAKELLAQEKLPAIQLLNLNGGKSWRIKSTAIGLFASINNALNYSYKSGGFEQSRNANYRALNQDVSSGTPSFSPKYYYGLGRSYFMNLSVRF